MAANDEGVWYATSDMIVRVATDVTVDVRFRRGDVIASELVPNCCFEGDYPQLSHHRTTGTRFSRRLFSALEPAAWTYWGGTPYAISPSRVLVESNAAYPQTTNVAVILGGTGELAGRIESDDVYAQRGLVVDRSGTAYAMRTDTTGGVRRILTIAQDGTVIRDVAWPGEAPSFANAFDLGADQCTLTYVGMPSGREGTVIGRIDVCTATALDTLDGDANERATDLRILPGGELLVVYRSRIVRLDPRGEVLQEITASADTPFLSIALDVDPGFLWVGTRRGLLRVRLDTGEVVARVETYGSPVRLSVVGEPRAARIVQRRRAVRAAAGGQ